MILQLLSLCYASYNPEQLTVFRSHLIKKWNMDKRRGETLCPKKTTDMWQKVLRWDEATVTLFLVDMPNSVWYYKDAFLQQKTGKTGGVNETVGITRATMVWH